MNRNEVAFMLLNLIFNLASVGQCLGVAAGARQQHVPKAALGPAVPVSSSLLPDNGENHKSDSNCGSCVQ